mmetsp:Transcript_38774/g.110619  ORF Transcript_38774/g.110619 Transcript_38774/m.110619 type:complete len:263 (-) Transcript_38774:167-955(-)
MHPSPEQARPACRNFQPGPPANPNPAPRGLRGHNRMFGQGTRTRHLGSALAPSAGASHACRRHPRPRPAAPRQSPTPPLPAPAPPPRAPALPAAAAGAAAAARPAPVPGAAVAAAARAARRAAHRQQVDLHPGGVRQRRTAPRSRWRPVWRNSTMPRTARTSQWRPAWRSSTTPRKAARMSPPELADEASARTPRCAGGWRSSARPWRPAARPTRRHRARRRTRRGPGPPRASRPCSRSWSRWRPRTRSTIACCARAAWEWS